MKHIYSKYKNQKTKLGGFTFDSKKEAERWVKLSLLQRAGEIHNLEKQVKYELQPKFTINGKVVRAITYTADFVYTVEGKTVVEDVKGMRTDVYKLKKKLFEYRYGIEIKEV